MASQTLTEVLANPGVYNCSDPDDYYALAYKTAYEVTAKYGYAYAKNLTYEEHMPWPFRSHGDEYKIEMWEMGWVDGIADADSHRASDGLD